MLVLYSLGYIALRMTTPPDTLTVRPGSGHDLDLILHAHPETCTLTLTAVILSIHHGRLTGQHTLAKHQSSLFVNAIVRPSAEGVNATEDRHVLLG
jgi:hypothetical protein